MTASDPTPKTSLVLRGSMLRLSKQTVQSKAVMKRRRFWRGSCWGENRLLVVSACGTKASSPGAFVGTGKTNRSAVGSERGAQSGIVISPTMKRLFSFILRLLPKCRVKMFEGRPDEQYARNYPRCTRPLLA